MLNRCVAKHAGSQDLVACQLVDQNDSSPVDKNNSVAQFVCVLLCFVLFQPCEECTTFSPLLWGWPPQAQRCHLSLKGCVCAWFGIFSFLNRLWEGLWYWTDWSNSDISLTIILWCVKSLVPKWGKVYKSHFLNGINKRRNKLTRNVLIQSRSDYLNNV